MAIPKSERRRLDDALSTPMWLTREILPWMGTTAFIGVVTMPSGSMVPTAAVGIFWGMSIVSSYFKREARKRLGGSAPEQIPAGRTPQPAAVRAPESVADIARDVGRIAPPLRKLKQGVVADRLELGLAEVVRLAELVAHAAVALEPLREEIATLSARAANAADAEAAELWSRNAESAQQRLKKAESLAASADRTLARIEGFRQVVRSLAVDLARLELSAEDPEALTAVAEHARLLERDVEALSRTSAEMGQLEREVREPKALAARQAQRLG